MALYVGTAGWSYPSGRGKWDDVFYPSGLAGWQKLPYYSERFNAVEINSSFYRPLSPADARGWAKRTPPDFHFTAKLYQKFTHPKMYLQARGQPSELQPKDFEEFQAGLEPLAEAGKLGALVAQFPPSFKADEAALEYLQDLASRFSAFPLAVELRHRSWTEIPQAGRVLEDLGIAWVMIDEPKFRTSIRHIPLTTPQLGYFRFHGRNYEQWWSHQVSEDRYNYLYSPEEQRQLAQQVRAVSERAQDTYVFYNNHYRAKAVVNAVQLKAELGLPVSADWHPGLLGEYPALEELVQQSAAGRAADARAAGPGGGLRRVGTGADGGAV